MKHETTFLTRCFAMFLAVLMALTGSNVGVALQAFAAEPDVTVSVGKLVADNYELTAEEEALLASGCLTGGTITYTVPTDSASNVTVDTDNKKITAKTVGDWVPTIARIVVGTEVKESIALDGGEGKYTYAENAFSVEVDYVLDLAVDTAVQETLLNTAAWLKQGVANLDAVAGQSGNLYILEQAMPSLVEFANKGVAIPALGPEAKATLSDEAIADINALNNQMTANAGKLDLSVAIEGYDASNETEYLLNSGAAMKAKVVDFIDKIGEIDGALAQLAKELESFIKWGLVDQATADQIEMLSGITTNLLNALKSVNEDPWTAAEKGTALVSETVDYAVLNALVAALGETTAMPVIKASLHVADTTLKVNMSMFNVTVKVSLSLVEDVVDADNLVEAGVQTVVLTLAEGATTEEILAAVEANGIVAAAKAAWGEKYAAEHFDENPGDLPETLIEDIDFEINFVPKIYHVMTDWGKELDVHYGYQMTLPAHDDPAKAYDYTVNGESYAQGQVIVITGNTNIERTSGKAYVSADLYSIIADNYGNKIAKDILQSGALKDNTFINVRKPDPADAESLLTLVDGLLTAENYDAAYNGLKWTPNTYGTEGNENAFSGNTASWTGKSAKVQYILKLTNFSVEEVAAVLELAKTLKAEAEAQKSTLDAFAANTGAMGQLDKVKLGALKGVIDVTDFTPGDGTDTDEANLDMREYFKGLVSGIIANNLDADGFLKIYNMMGEYETEGLKYYYENYAAFINEIESLAGYLHGMMEDEAKMAALEIMVTAAGFPEYAEKIVDLESKLTNVLNSLSEPNKAIDLTSKNLGKLINALTAEGEVICAEADYAYLLSEKLTALDESQVIVQVIIETPNGNATVTSAEMVRGTVLTQAVIDGLKAKVEAEIANLLGENKDFYTVSVSGSTLDSLVGQELISNANIYYIAAPTVYYAVIDGEADQVVTINDLEINLPKHPNAPAWRYEYTVDGVSGIVTSTYTFTAEQLGRLFNGGEYKITRVAVDQGAEKLDKMIKSLNEAVKKSGGSVTKVTDENGVCTGINVNIPANGMMDFAMGLMSSGYTYIGLNGEGFLYMDAENTLELSLQTLINAVLNDNGFGSETLIALGNNNGGKLATTSLQLGNSADEIIYEDLAFNLTLTSVPSQMGTVSNGLASIRNYMSFQSKDGVLQIKLNLPEKVYEAYLAVMLATGHVDKSDTNAINSAIAFNFLYDYIELILNTDANTVSFTNTLAKLGQSYDLTGYEGYYQKVKSFLTSDGVEIKADEDFTVALSVGGKSAIDKLLSFLALELTEDQAKALGMLREYKAGNTIDATVVATMVNTDVEFGVAVVDIKNASTLNKIDFAKVGASVSRINSLAGQAAVMLLSDLNGNLVFNHATILDLNGKTINGNIVANGTLYIIDSSLDTTDCGGVNGTISGNVKIIAGNYTQDVSNYLSKGYVWNNGPVSNALYTIDTVKDGNGKIVDVTFNINSDVYKEVDGYIPSVKALAVDIAADLVLNYYTTAALSIDGDTLVAVDLQDVFELLEGNKTENVVNELLSWIHVDTGITGFINNVIEDLLNFEAIANGIENDTPVASYELTTNPWQIVVNHVTDGDYITVGITNNAELAKTHNVHLVITGDAAKTHLLPRVKELANIITDETHVTVALTQPTYDNKTLSGIGGTVEAVLAADLTVNANYTTVIGVVLAYGNPAKAQAFVDAINANDMDALKAAFDATSVKEVFDALKKLSRNVNFATMASELGVTVNTADAAKLESLYHLVLCGVGKVLEKLDITGYTNKKMGYLYDAETGYYTLSKLNVNRNGDVSYGGFTAEFDATITEVTLKVKIFGEPVEEVCLWGDANHDGVVDGKDATLILQYELGVAPEGFCTVRTDVNGDGEIDGKDATLVLQHEVGIITKFPVEE